MTQSCHKTALPWKVGETGNLIEAGDEIICRFFDRDEEDFPNKEANAVFIVLAANNHDALVDKLWKMVAWHDGTNEREYVPMDKLLEEARALLASIKG